MVNKRCLCIKEFNAANGRTYYSDVYYRIVGSREMYNVASQMCRVVNEIATDNNGWMGYIALEDFEKYFICEDDILFEDNNIFNNIMDEDI